MKINITDISNHRNGICGDSFHVILFNVEGEPDQQNMMATVFSGSGQCAVMSIPELAKGNIAFACGNSWRGDHYEDAMRDAIEAYRHAPPDARTSAAVGKFIDDFIEQKSKAVKA